MKKNTISLRIFSLIGLVLVAIILLTNWSTGCGGLGGGSLGLISTDQEVQFGSQAHEELLLEYTECIECRTIEVDPQSGLTITGYVETIGQEMSTIGNPDRGSATNQIPVWHFTVLESDEINAFALPGGYVYVTTALLETMENKAELVGVIGHEVGHVTNYHGIDRLEKFMLAQGLSTLFFGDDAEMAETAQMVVGLTDFFVSSQDDELEADSSGVTYAFNGGYDPEEMNRFFESILPLYEGQDDFLSDILSSHPHPQTRIDQVNAKSASLGVTEASSLIVDDSAVPYSAVKDALALRSHASYIPDLRNLSPRTRAILHACHFNPLTRQITDLHLH